MTNMYKRVLMSLTVITVLATNIIAKEESYSNKSGKFLALTWSPNTKDGTIDGYDLTGGGMLGLYGGKTNFFTDKIGMYGGIDKSYNLVDDTGTSYEVMYAYTILNVGLTYTPVENLTLMAGVGFSMEKAEFMYDHNVYHSFEDNDQINFNVEVSYKVTDSYGIVIGYNSAPEALNIGFSKFF